MPVNPVPIVSAFEAVAVTVTEPPKLTDDPLIVIALLVSEALAMLVSVLLAPLIVLFVSVCALSVSTSVLLAGIVVPFNVVVELLVNVVNAPVEGVEAPTEPLNAPLVLVKDVNTPVFGVVLPIAAFTEPPELANNEKIAGAGVVIPIDVPSILPPVIATAFAFWVDIVPNPVIDVFGIVVLAVMMPVPLPYT